MKQPKIKWRVDPPPTGSWKSFAKRGWPMGFVDEQMYFNLFCDESYTSAIAKSGQHGPIEIRVAKRIHRPVGFDWRRLTKRGATLAEAKTIAQDFLNRNPDYFKNPEAPFNPVELGVALFRKSK